MSSDSLFQSIDQCVEEIRKHQQVKLCNSGKFKGAYCCLLYGACPSESLIANAIVLGRSLTNSGYPLILLVTSDVPDSVRSRLMTEMKPNTLCLVEYIYGDWEYDKVIFLDLDILVNNVVKMDALFEMDCLFGAMENSKGQSAPKFFHGESMGAECGLINAGVMIITPDAALFSLLVEDVTRPSVSHIPGMTPEQFYLARVMGHHFHHLSQIYNFEVQYHGGVPVGDIWTNFGDPAEIVAFHFSGGDPLNFTNFESDDIGCQSHKWYAKKFWEEQLTSETRKRASNRAKFAFEKWHKVLSF